MEGIKEKHQVLDDFNHPVENQKEEQKLGLGFQNLDFTGPNLDHQSVGDVNDNLSKKFHEMALEGSSNGEKEVVSGLVLASAMDKKRSQTEEGSDKKGLIGGDDDQVGDCGLEGFSDGGVVRVDDVKGENKTNTEESDVKIEESDPKKGNVVGEKEGDVKEMKEGGNDKEGSKWSEIEDEEEYNDIEVKDDVVAGDKECIIEYENEWGENWDDGVGRTEDDEKQQYIDEMNGNEQYNEELDWYGNVEGDLVGLNNGHSENCYYPLRPDAEDCSFYMKTGSCKFGRTCKFNHPLKRKDQAARDTYKQMEENSDMPGRTKCKYHLTSDGCKYGKACRYNHGRGKPAVAPILEFNFLGLPIRMGEKECPYYMRTGSCKYGSTCRFNHPDPTVAGGGDIGSQGSSIKDTFSSWSSAKRLNETAYSVPLIYPPSPTAPPNGDWNGYQTPAYPTSDRKLPAPPAFAMNCLPTDGNFYAPPQKQPIVEEFPERPGQPECSYYLRTGNCKYRSTCKYHHPKNWKAFVTLNDHGLPLRPGQSICAHYSHYGLCKFGPACKHDHSVRNGASASSNRSDQGQPPRYGKLGEADEWNMELVQQF